MCVETRPAGGTHRLVMRGYLNGAIIYQSEMHLTEREIEPVAFMLALEHVEQMANGEITMMEFEFPDHPPEERYFRIGTDPTGMVQPIRIDL